MPVSPPLPLLKRIPPGLGPGLVWFLAAIAPIVEYVMLPQRHRLSYSYPRDGLDSFTAKAVLVLAFALVVAGCALLRRRTLVAYGLVVAGTVVLALAWRQDEIPPLQFIGADLTLAYAASVLPRRDSLIAVAGTLGVLAGYLVLREFLGDDAGTAGEPYVALTVVIAWLIGNSVSQARAHTKEVQARAAEQAVTAERLRIAREMHDTVAHSVGIIALQAGAAARVVDTQPARAREAMLAVEKAGRETLSGLRRMLGTLREGDDQPSPLHPAAGLDDVERLAETTTTATGVRVEVWWKGKRRPLPSEIDLTAFRIVQESVTNVVKHSGAGSCRISIEYRDNEIALQIRDDGEGGLSTKGAGTGTGYGLAGMRERVALLHGDFTAGPRSGGGFLVTARLPVPDRNPTTAATATPPPATTSTSNDLKAEAR